MKLADVEVLRSGQWRDGEMYLFGLTKKRRGSTNGPGFGLVVIPLADDRTIPLMRRVG
jgi:hypothetical protein